MPHPQPQPLSTVDAARRSLAQFAVGRTLSAIVGVASLLLLVRVLGRDEYGLYIALLAGFEVVQIAASPGAHAVVFRFMPELRAPGAAAALVRLVVRVSSYGLVTLALAAAALALGAERVTTMLGAPHQAHALRLFALVMVFEGTARLFDAQFESLLEQGKAQLSALIRNAARLGALGLLSQFGTVELTLSAWIAVEATTTAAGLGATAGLMAWHLRRQLRSAGAQAVRTQGFPLDRLSHFAAPSWAAHLVGVASGVEMAKLLASNFIGAAAAAPFGFAAVLAGTLQRYLPSFLLLGWIRPLLIAAREAGRPTEGLVALAGTVVKLNLLVIAPLVCVVAAAGPQLVRLLAGGRLPESLPFVAFFVLLLTVQAVRAAVALLGVTMELGVASLQATLASVGGLVLGIVTFPWFGAWAFCLGLVTGELVWIAVMASALRRVDLCFVLPWPAIARLAASVLITVTAAKAWLAAVPAAAASESLVLATGLASAPLCLALAAAWRSFDAGERELINRLLPARLFVW